MQRVYSTVIVRVALSLVVIVSCTALRAENWPMWRGPQGDGTSQEQHVPVSWDATQGKNLVWRVEVPGEGHASPIVWEDRVFVVTCLTEENERRLLCYDRQSGRLLWQQTVLQAPLETKHTLNSYASSTPATDGEKVYVTFLDTGSKDAPDPNQSERKRNATGKMIVVAYTLDGEEVWRVNAGAFSSIHGFCSSPVIFEDLLIINGDHDGDAFLVGLERANGKVRWRADRENRTRSYSTPIIRKIDDRLQLMLSGNKCVASYDPRTGARHWIIDGPTEQFAASVVYNGEFVFATGGYPDYHLLAIRPDGRGNVTDTHIAWRTTRACSYVPSPIVVGKYFLMTSDGGIGSCYEASSGERLWLERLGRHYSGSPVTIAGLVYLTDDDGITKVVRPGSSLEVLSENKLGERCFSSPAVSQGQIIFRGEKHLFCFGEK